MASELYKQVLDHGYVEHVEHWGTDRLIVESARMSTGTDFRGWGKQCTLCDGTGYVSSYTCMWCGGKGGSSGDERLLRRLWMDRHTSPFEMCGMTIEVQAPLLVLRQWHRHRTQSYSELSGRYTPLPDFDYVPTVDRLLTDTNGDNKQAGRAAGTPPLTKEAAEQVIADLRAHYQACQERYLRYLAAGVPKELARIHLPLARYTRMRASGNLKNWMDFITLRAASDAQWEICQYADAVLELMQKLFPRTASVFLERRQAFLKFDEVMKGGNR